MSNLTFFFLFIPNLTKRAKWSNFYISLSNSLIQNIFVFCYLLWLFYISAITYIVSIMLPYHDMIGGKYSFLHYLVCLTVCLIFVWLQKEHEKDRNFFSRKLAHKKKQKKKKKTAQISNLMFCIEKFLIHNFYLLLHLCAAFLLTSIFWGSISTICEWSLPIFSSLYRETLYLAEFFVSCFNFNPLSLISLFNFLIISGFISINIYLFSEDFEDCLFYFLYRLFRFYSIIYLNPQLSLWILSLSPIFISALSMIFYGLSYFLFNFSRGIIYIFPLFFTDIEILWDFSNLSDFNESYWVPLDFWKNLLITRFPEGFDSLAANGGGPGNWERPTLAYDPDEDYDTLADLLRRVGIHECPLPGQLLPHIYDTEVAQRLTLFAKLKSMDIRQDNYLASYVERGEAAKIVEKSFQTAYTTFKDSYVVYLRDVQAGTSLPAQREACRFAMQDLRLKTIIAQICIECDKAYKDYPSLGDKPRFPTSCTGISPEITWQFLKSIYSQYQADQEWYSRLHISNLDTKIAQEKSVRSNILFDVQYSFWERHNPTGLFNPNGFLSHGEQVDIMRILRAVYRLEYFPGSGRNIDDSPILRAVYNPFFQSRVQFP